MMVLLKICLPSFSLVMTVLNVTEPAGIDRPAAATRRSRRSLCCTRHGRHGCG